MRTALYVSPTCIEEVTIIAVPPVSLFVSFFFPDRQLKSNNRSDAAGDCSELADDLNKDQPQGDDVSMIGDSILYNPMPVSSYQGIGPDSIDSSMMTVQ